MSFDGRAAHDFCRPVFWPAGQLLTGQSRNAAVFIAIVATAAATALACRPSPGPTPADAKALSRGGAIVVSIRTEPRSFNRLVARDTSTELVSTLTQAKLVRINQATQEVEPLARRKLDSRGRRPARHAEAAPGRHVLRRPPVHGRRCGVLVRGGVRPRGGERAGRRAPGRRQESAGDGARSAHRRGHVSAAVRAGRAPARQPADPPAAQARSAAQGRHVRHGVGPVDAAVGDRRPRPVRAVAVRRPASGWSSTATRTTSARPTTARRCRTSIASPSRSSPTRTPSCCGSRPGSST